MPTHSELKAIIAKLELQLANAKFAAEAAMAAAKGMQEERDSYKACVELYANANNWEGDTYKVYCFPNDGPKAARECLAKWEGG